MPQSRRVLLIVAVLFAIPWSGALAQPADTQTRWTAGASLGAGTTLDDESSLGWGVGVAGRAGWRLAPRTSIEGGVSVLEHDRSGTFEAHGRTTSVEAALVQEFGSPGVRPFVTGGALVAHHGGRTGFPSTGLTSETESTDAGVFGGGGVLWRAGARVALGPEARFIVFRPESGSAPAYAWTAGVRIGVDF